MPTRTPSGKLTALGDVEGKLRREYGTGKKADAYVYGTLNRIGLMRGNRVTSKGTKTAVSPYKKQQARAKSKPGMRWK